MEEAYVLIDHCCGGEILAISASRKNVETLRLEAAKKKPHEPDELFVFKIPLEKYLEDFTTFVEEDSE